MSNFVVDVEADGPCPGLYSMVCFGAVKVGDHKTTFYGQCRPISELWVRDALKVSGFTREQCIDFQDPDLTMTEFLEWVGQVNEDDRPIFWSDNIAFDWQFINYYFHRYTKFNPFGYSGRRIGDYYCGLQKNPRANWKFLRDTRHDHNPVNDAIGNAEAMIKMGIK